MPSIAASSMRASSRSAAETPGMSASTLASALAALIPGAPRVPTPPPPNIWPRPCSEPPPRHKMLRGRGRGSVIALVVCATVEPAAAANALAEGALKIFVIIVNSDGGARVARAAAQGRGRESIDAATAELSICSSMSSSST